MFAIGSLLFASVSARKTQQDWLCFRSTGVCYMNTEDVSQVAQKKPVEQCRPVNSNLHVLASTFMDNYIHELCGCQYCSFTEAAYALPEGTAPPANSASVFINVADETMMSAEQDYVFEAVTNQMDMNNFLPGLVWESRKYTMSICRKPWVNFAKELATCEPLIQCEANKACPAKDKKNKAEREASAKESTNNASNDLKALWGLLFLPGFLVGACAAYCYYRHRRTQSRDSARGQDIEARQNTHVGVQPNVPVQQTHHDSPNVQYIQNGHRANGQQNHVDNVPHAVTRPQMA